MKFCLHCCVKSRVSEFKLNFDHWNFISPSLSSSQSQMIWPPPTSPHHWSTRQLFTMSIMVSGWTVWMFFYLLSNDWVRVRIWIWYDRWYMNMNILNMDRLPFCFLLIMYLSPGHYCQLGWKSNVFMTDTHFITISSIILKSTTWKPDGNIRITKVDRSRLLSDTNSFQVQWSWSKLMSHHHESLQVKPPGRCQYIWLDDKLK